MKTIRHIVAVLIKSAIVLSPGIAAAIWLRDTPGWPVAVLAALGVEFVTCVLITFTMTVAAQIKAQRDLKKEKTEPSAD